jgi:N utilization substance protein B
MRKRTKAREQALQILYQIDVSHIESEKALEDFWQNHLCADEVKDFTNRLVRGASSHIKEIDALITANASNWEINRMAVVDRNILRMGVFELLHMEDVPPKVCLNEAVELAKRFGDEESSKFVNGILDTIHKTCNRKASVPEAPSSDAPKGCENI